MPKNCESVISFSVGRMAKKSSDIVDRECVAFVAKEITKGRFGGSRKVGDLYPKSSFQSNEILYHCQEIYITELPHS